MDYQINIDGAKYDLGFNTNADGIYQRVVCGVLPANILQW